MTQRGPFLFLVALLILAGIGTAAFRHQEYRIPLLPGAQQTVWQVEARVEYFAQGGATEVFLTLPPEQSGFRVLTAENGSIPR
ncbi:MAG: UUP1 family membrane protein, partial [Proteobacteria bacterium]|nr:UUP1 family membrane protein [Pseudomonadota bacterium]